MAISDRVEWGTDTLREEFKTLATQAREELAHDTLVDEAVPDPATVAGLGPMIGPKKESDPRALPDVAFSDDSGDGIRFAPFSLKKP